MPILDDYNTDRPWFNQEVPDADTLDQRLRAHGYPSPEALPWMRLPVPEGYTQEKFTVRPTLEYTIADYHIPWFVMALAYIGIASCSYYVTVIALLLWGTL